MVWYVTLGSICLEYLLLRSLKALAVLPSSPWANGSISIYESQTKKHGILTIDHCPFTMSGLYSPLHTHIPQKFIPLRAVSIIFPLISHPDLNRTRLKSSLQDRQPVCRAPTPK